MIIEIITSTDIDLGTTVGADFWGLFGKSIGNNIPKIAKEVVGNTLKGSNASSALGSTVGAVVEDSLTGAGEIVGKKPGNTLTQARIKITTFREDLL